MRNYVNHDRVIQLYKDGQSGSDIAEILGCCKATVSRVLNKAGYSVKTGMDKGKVLALARAGWKVEDIAWDMKITEEEVRQVLAGETKEA